MKLTCCKEIHFGSGHRVMGHESKCAHLHGHNYKVELHASARSQDDVGRIIDFSVLKEKVGGWIDKYWDHGFILHNNDEPGKGAIEAFNRDMRLFDAPAFHQKLHFMPDNPTAENMARYLGEVVGPSTLEGTGVCLCRVVVHETYSCSAEWRLEA